MRLFIAFLMLLTGAAAHAEIYRVIGADGQVTYTDEQPSDGRSFDKVELEPDSAGVDLAPSKPAVSIKPAPSETPPASYRRLEILSPEHDTSVRQNAGNVAIQLAIEPPLRTDAGHEIVITLDGVPVTQGTALSYRLDNVDRGTHRLKAEVRSAAGALVSSSKVVEFTLQRVAVGGRRVNVN